MKQNSKLGHGRKFFFINLLLLCSFAAARAEGEKYAGAFLEIPLGSRAMGMGSAFTSVANDGTAFYWNPAGTALVQTRILSAMYSSQHGAIGNPLANYFYTGVTMPISKINVAVNWIRFSADDMRYYDDHTQVKSATEREALVRAASQDNFFSNSEDAFVFTLSKNFPFKIDWGWSLFELPIEIPVGMNFKMIRQSIADNSSSGIGIDLGTMIRFNLKDIFFSDNWPQLSFGVSLRDIGNTKLTWSTQRQHLIESSYAWGMSVNQPLEFIDGDLILSYDRDERYDGSNNLGMEFLYKKIFAFRTGIQNSAFTAGAGVDFNFFSVDYSYLGGSERTLGGVHRLGGAFQLDKLFTK